MSCRHAQLRTECGTEAADWQTMFSYRLGNVIPGIIDELLHPDGENHTSLGNCSSFSHGTLHTVLSLLSALCYVILKNIQYSTDVKLGCKVIKLKTNLVLWKRET